LTNSDLLDCVTDFARKDSIDAKRQNSKLVAMNIPAWSTWTQEEWQTYFGKNLNDTEVDKVTTIAFARVMMKRQNLVIENLVKMVLALRDRQWPDLSLSHGDTNDNKNNRSIQRQ
jgi:hypothetical protein